MNCEIEAIHPHIVEKVRDKLISEERLISVSDFFKVLGDGTRLRILNALMISEMCVCDVAFVLGMTQSAISHQLKALKQARLVKSRKEGKVVFYSLDDDHVKGILDKGLEHLDHD